MKRMNKFLVLAILGAVLLGGNVKAATLANYNLTLYNSGQSYNYLSTSYNKKTYINDNWTLKVNSITCSGPYGISFCPVQYNPSANAIIKKCTGSSIWRNGTGYRTIAYATNENALVNYRLGARMDDDYSGSFRAAGWFNADTVSNQ